MIITKRFSSTWQKSNARTLFLVPYSLACLSEGLLASLEGYFSSQQFERLLGCPHWLRVAARIDTQQTREIEALP